MQVHVETERLRLREFTPDDLDQLAQLHGDPRVMRLVDDGLPVPRERVERVFLPKALREYRRRPPGMGCLAAETIADGRFCGWLATRPCQGRDLGEGLELGWRLHPEVWGRGLASEGARALVRSAFDKLGADRVAATTMVVNRPSWRVMEKAGLRYSHIFFEQWEEPLPGAELGDVVYALTRPEYRAAVE